MTDQATEIVIQSFHPLSITLPEGDTLQGKVRIVLPEVHVKVFDLSMGGILPGAHLGADVQMLGVDMEFNEPFPVDKFMLLVIEAKDALEKEWREGQKVIDERGALSRGTQIIYVPDHAEDDIDHPDCEHGFVTSVRGDVAFCRYWSKHHRGLRTVSNSESTPIRNLVAMDTRDQLLVQELLEGMP